ncbi:UNKNOWN [Stylonychia lemnae]|uniref:GAR domain-containing protein n=1 Tax=Stylonychia lemnae TaxID=5949 RepID=A0A077ZQ58_STYLE|nr:UNKNOWN [Stylonychia lemnae]|eukprot:CDW72038.1 UNKNOWN [Stylonychia lemnae]
MGNYISTTQKPKFYFYLAIGILTVYVAISQIYGKMNQNQNGENDPNNYYEKYGDNNQGQDQKSWIVVTGGSDALGLAFCERLATQGFNVCIIGSDEKKINEKIQLIKEKNPNIQTYIVLSDLKQFSTIKDYQEIALKLQQFDIAMLFINSSWNNIAPLHQIPLNQIEELTNFNTLQSLYLTKALIPKLQSRNQKSAIVFSSSFLGTVVIPGTLTYKMSKKFISVIADNLYKELKNNSQIDVLSFEAFAKDYDYLKDISEIEEQEESKNLLEELKFIGEDLLRQIQETPVIKITSKVMNGHNNRTRQKDLCSGFEGSQKKIEESLELDFGQVERLEVEVIDEPKQEEVIEEKPEEQNEIFEQEQQQQQQEEEGPLQQSPEEQNKEEIEEYQEKQEQLDQQEAQEVQEIQEIQEIQEDQEVQNVKEEEIEEEQQIDVQQSEEKQEQIKVADDDIQEDDDDGIPDEDEDDNIEDQETSIVIENKIHSVYSGFRPRRMDTANKSSGFLQFQVETSEISLGGDDDIDSFLGGKIELPVVEEQPIIEEQPLIEEQAIIEEEQAQIVEEPAEELQLEEVQQIQKDKQQVQQEDSSLQQQEFPILEDQHQDENQANQVELQLDESQITDLLTQEEVKFEIEKQFEEAQVDNEQMEIKLDEAQEDVEEIQEVQPDQENTVEISLEEVQEQLLEDQKQEQAIEEDDGQLQQQIETQISDQQMPEESPTVIEEEVKLPVEDEEKITPRSSIKSEREEEEEKSSSSKKEGEADDYDPISQKLKQQLGSALALGLKRYKSIRGDTVDELVESVVNKSDIQVPIIRMMQGKYLIGTESKLLIIKGVSVMVRIGGGFEKLDEYIQRNQKNELDKLKKMMNDKKKTYNQVMVDLLKQYCKDEKVVKNFLKNNKDNGLQEKYSPKVAVQSQKQQENTISPLRNPKQVNKQLIKEEDSDLEEDY